ncbi:hypothetical protein [Paraburkholderia lycopersici]|uniref:Preprotein translocase subunit SecA n=1 Tax=Paraburkholderia lycopersici TaxID=416944 RepID=A0A1G6QCY8_9BURK|nr:hypothetical protein [Paraburkholderia lycopersici]SDC90051.1 hypothetical protein SAMN05421548_111168 [Paraburkholderia lycopersici]
MLSPHEFATLMLVRQAPDQLDMNRAELDALLERQLVMLEHCTAGGRRAHLTDKGRSFLDALHPDGALRRAVTRAAKRGADGRGTPAAPGDNTTDIEVSGNAG